MGRVLEHLIYINQRLSDSVKYNEATLMKKRLLNKESTLAKEKQYARLSSNTALSNMQKIGLQLK